MKIKFLEEKFFKVVMIFSAVIILGILLYILGTIFIKGFPSLSLDMITKLPGGVFISARKVGSSML